MPFPRTKIATSLLAVALAGCGGGASAPQWPAPAPNLLAAQLPGQAVAVYGDSTEYGLTLTATGYQRVDVPAPAREGKLLGLQVENRGIGGSTTATWLDGTGTPQTWATEMAGTSASIIVLQWGINDADHGMDVAAFVANLDALARAARAAGKRVVIETANPVSQGDLARLDAMVTAELIYARQNGLDVIDQYHALGADPAWAAKLSDGTHPTQDGYDEKATIAAQALQGLLP